MSKTNFTPGPWRIGRVGSVVADHPVPEVGGTDCIEYYGGHCVAESLSKANAHLIAAGPEMYEAGDEALAALYGAREVLGDVANLSHAINMLESAARKARGEK